MNPEIETAVRANRNAWAIYDPGMPGFEAHRANLAAEYDALVKRALGPSQDELRAIAAAYVRRPDRTLYNFTCAVFWRTP
jgi:hypothetical protein